MTRLEIKKTQNEKDYNFLKNNKKNGYCLRYNQQKLVKAEKYQQGKKIKEWTDLASFKKENSLFDLR